MKKFLLVLSLSVAFILLAGLFLPQLVLGDISYGLWLDQSVNPAEFSDWAWSDENIGWVSFNCVDRGICGVSDYKVIIGTTIAVPTVSNLTLAFENPCSQSRIPKFYWETNAEKPYDYEIRICRNNDCSHPQDPLIERLVENTISNSWAPGCSRCCLVFTYDRVDFGGHDYFGQVRARNLDSQWSVWTVSDSKTYENCFPSPEFHCNEDACDNLSVSEKEIVYLTNESTIYNGLADCLWELPVGAQLVEGFNLTDCDIQAQFNSGKDQAITLTVSDSNNYSCSFTRNINVRLPLPEYREVAPVSLLNWPRNYLNRLEDVFNE